MRAWYPAGNNGGNAHAHHAFTPQDVVYVKYNRKFGTEWVFNPARPMHSTYLFAGAYVSPTTADLTIYEDNDQAAQRTSLTVKSSYQNGMIVPLGVSYTINSYPVMPNNIATPISFVTGQWYEIQYMAKMNTVGNQDGELKLWVDGVLVSDLQNLVLRDASHPTIQFDHFMFGPNYPPSGPVSDQSNYIDDIVISKNFISPVERLACWWSRLG
jgi:hypothetical protein